MVWYNSFGRQVFNPSVPKSRSCCYQQCWGRWEYNAVSLETVCAREIFFVDCARDAILLESLSKCQSSKSTTNDDNMKLLHLDFIMEGYCVKTYVLLLL